MAQPKTPKRATRSTGSAARATTQVRAKARRAAERGGPVGAPARARRESGRAAPAGDETVPTSTRGRGVKVTSSHRAKEDVGVRPGTIRTSRPPVARRVGEGGARADDTHPTSRTILRRSGAVAIEGIERVAESLESAATGTVDSVVRRAHEAAELGSGAFHRVVTRVGGAAEEVRDRLEDAAEGVRDRLGDAADQVRAAAAAPEIVSPSQLDRGLRRLENGLERLVDRVSVITGLGAANERSEALGSRVREHPALSLGIAAGAGWLIGRIFRIGP